MGKASFTPGRTSMLRLIRLPNVNAGAVWGWAGLANKDIFRNERAGGMKT